MLNNAAAGNTKIGGKELLFRKPLIICIILLLLLLPQLRYKE